MSTQDLIDGVDGSGHLKVFFDSIFEMKFEEAPEYS